MDSIRVLYVEGNPTDQEATHDHLERHAPHIKLTVVGTVSEAVERVTIGDMDVMLADYRLPDGTGLDLLDAVKSRGLEVPVVLVTGSGDMDITVRRASIVRNFLALARKHPPERQLVRLNDIARDAAELLAYHLRVDRIEVRLDLTEGLPVLWADPHQLHQVVVNLVTNARDELRRAPEPRRLILKTRADATRGRVSLDVEDTGPGISPEIRDRIFEPFFTTKPVGQGTGLGLSLCHGIVEGHGGTLSLVSEARRGAIFRVELPVVAPPTTSGKHGADAPAVVKGKRILVVDDERLVLQLLGEMLGADHHTVDTVADGTQALEQLRRASYDLILSDVRMPYLDGPGLYRALERRLPDLCRRFVLMTGDVLSAEIQTFLDQTGVPGLSKPFDRSEVRRVIQLVANDRA